MKKSTQVLVVVALCSALGIQAQNNIVGNGKMQTEKRTTAEYDEINVSGFYDVVLVSGTEGKITVEAEENLLPHIKTEVSGKTLKIYKDNINLKTKKNVTITVPIEQINALSLSGSGDISSNTTIFSPKMQAKLSGSGDITLDLKCTDVETYLSGSGDITLKGTAENFDTKISGSGDVEASDLLSQNAKVTVSGSGDVNVHCVQNLYVRVAGSGDVHYKGNPNSKDTKVSGSGDISKM